MSDDLHLALKERTVLGKSVKHLRRDSLTPAVIHDHGKPSVIVSADHLALLKAYHQAGKHHPIELTVGSKKFTALIKEAEFEPRKRQLNHVVFGAVKADEKVEAEIPLKLSEEIPAEKLSLVVITQLDVIKVEAFPKDLPDEIIVDASGLAEVGDKVTVADIKLPAGVTLAEEDESDQLIAVVYEPSALAAANDAVGGTAEPEEAEAVPSEHETSAEENTQADEIRPGGKEGFEDKEQGHNPEKK
ncbi:MAG TPA: 50S ribosomal protein L25 [Candidatus Binatia bacterium]|nr:50S ribosomal protein L25 [Candidatus Binatia bacterium]